MAQKSFVFILTKMQYVKPKAVSIDKVIEINQHSHAENHTSSKYTTFYNYTDLAD